MSKNKKGKTQVNPKNQTKKREKSLVSAKKNVKKAPSKSSSQISKAKKTSSLKKEIEWKKETEGLVKSESAARSDLVKKERVKKQSTTEGKKVVKPKFGILSGRTSGGRSSPPSKTSEEELEEKKPVKGVEGQQSPSQESMSPTDSHHQKWLAYRKKYSNIEPKPYNMSETFDEKTPIEHPKWGWGFILSKENDRLQVLFADGIKVLISNYKPNLKI